MVSASLAPSGWIDRDLEKFSRDRQQVLPLAYTNLFQCTQDGLGKGPEGSSGWKGLEDFPYEERLRDHDWFSLGKKTQIQGIWGCHAVDGCKSGARAGERKKTGLS